MKIVIRGRGKSCRMKNVLKNKWMYELWQTEWQDLSLEKICVLTHKKKSEVVSADFFQEFYRMLGANGWKFQINYYKDKNRYARWLEKTVQSVTAEKKMINPKCLSVGCGVGLIEAYMIKKGYDVELQECQSASFSYLKSKDIKVAKYWVSQDLSELPDASYDVVWTNLVLYCMKDEEIKGIVKNVSRILKKGGIFIIVDTAPQLGDFLKEKLAGKKYHRGVFWGYIRSVLEYERLVKEFFRTRRRVWLLKSRNGSYKECRPRTILGFNVRHYKNARVELARIICEKK